MMKEDAALCSNELTLERYYKLACLLRDGDYMFRFFAGECKWFLHDNLHTLQRLV